MISENRGYTHELAKLIQLDLHNQKIILGTEDIKDPTKLRSKETSYPPEEA